MCTCNAMAEGCAGESFLRKPWMDARGCTRLQRPLPKRLWCYSSRPTGGSVHPNAIVGAVDCGMGFRWSVCSEWARLFAKEQVDAFLDIYTLEYSLRRQDCHYNPRQ